jgi:hypothetical protein
MEETMGPSGMAVDQICSKRKTSKIKETPGGVKLPTIWHPAQKPSEFKMTHYLGA